MLDGGGFGFISEFDLGEVGKRWKIESSVVF